jgi:hypothetical protein
VPKLLVLSIKTLIVFVPLLLKNSNSLTTRNDAPAPLLFAVSIGLADEPLKDDATVVVAPLAVTVASVSDSEVKNPDTVPVATEAAVTCPKVSNVKLMSCIKVVPPLLSLEILPTLEVSA